MIKISKLNKSYKDQQVLKNINITLPDKGLIAIMGESGCGKSTLLKCIGGLINYQGQIKVNNLNISRLNQHEMAEFRLKEYGFVFQNFSLFNNETILRNIIFPLEVLTNEDKRIKRRIVNDCLKAVNLNQPLNKIVYKLSGGEKQRVAIARALINNPKVILADEPTGALDNKNAHNIMEVLLKASKKRLVIVVSHDEALMKKYADSIYYMKDGKIDEIKDYARANKEKSLAIINTLKRKKKHTIPLLFLIKHSFLVIKEKIFRMSFVTLMTSLGLLAVGLSISITSLVSTSIKKSYSALIDENQIIISDPNREVDSTLSLANYEEIEEIKNNNPEYVNDISVIYFNDFENFFTTSNQFYISSLGVKRPIEGLTARSINEYKDLITADEVFYPNKPESLTSEEIVCSLTMDNIEDICFALRIVRTLTSLIEYISNNDIYIVLETANDNWEYDDEQLFKIKAFCLSNESSIYHYLNNFNEIIFEEKMRFPTSLEYNLPLDRPYYLRKGYCLNISNKDEFLYLTYHNKHLSEFVFELSKDYYKYLYLNNSYEECDRLIVFNNPNKSSLKIYNEQYFYKSTDKIKNPIYGTKSGIVIYEDSLLMGFANNMFISSNEEKLIENNEINSYLSNEESQNLVTDEDVIMGSFYKVKSEGLTFESRNDYSNDYNHIAISSKLAKRLYNQDDPINKKIYLSYVNKTYTYPNGSVIRNFMNKELIVSDVYESDNYVIYHNPMWSIIFFQTRLGISSFNLLINNISFKNEGGEEINEKLTKDFPTFQITSPLKDVNQSVDEICHYMVIALLVFSILCIIISTLLIIITNYLFALETRKDINLALILGVNKKESGKFVSTNTYVLGFMSFIMASVELVFLSMILSNSISSLNINFVSIIVMFVISLFISFFTSKIVKMITLKSLKEEK